MIHQALPTLQGAIDALHARLTVGRERASGAAIVTGMIGPVATLSPEALDVLGDILSGRFREQMSAIWGREDIAAQGTSEQDWAFECEAAYHAIARDFDGDDLHRIVEEIIRAGLYRQKHDDRRGRTTWLAQDVANAIATVKKRIGAKSGPILDLDEDTPAAPADETYSQTVARLERELRNVKAAHAVLQATLRATRAELERERELRARDRRLMLAEQRLDRCSKFNAGQKSAIKAVARIAPALANSLGKDDPILTREMVAKVYGAKEETAGGHLKVFDLAGSPVPRVLKPYGATALTHYKLETRDPIEIIDRMAALGEQLDKRPAPRQRVQCRTCPEGTGTIVNIVCEGCGGLLDERHVAAPKAEPLPNAGKNPPLEETPSTVDVVTLRAEKPAVAGAADGLDELTLARRAREAVAVPARGPDRWKRPDPDPVSLGRIQMTGRNGHAPPASTPIAGFAFGDTKITLDDPMTIEGLMVDADGTPYLAAAGPPSKPAPWRCPECPASERKVLPDGSSRCPRGHIERDSAEVAG